eukprot:scaffold110491_cov47-Phaeocystis_antarctica.AAC.1
MRSKSASNTLCRSARSAALKLPAPAVLRCRLPGRYSTKPLSRAPNRGLASAPAQPAAAVAGKSWTAREDRRAATTTHRRLQP